MPSFTQNAKEHDVVIVVDEGNLFADYLPYRTWDAKPVVGSAGLVPTTWHPAVELWGGTQFQNRFKRMSGRTMRPLEDYNVWMAVRSIGEAATRTESNAPASLIKYIGSKEFELAAFKGQKLTYRDWNGQLRQPVLLVTGKLHVTVSPQAELPAPVLRARHARDRPARDEVPGLHAMTVPGGKPFQEDHASMSRFGLRGVFLVAALFLADGARRRLHRFVSNEKENTVSVIDSATLEVVHTIKVGNGRAASSLANDNNWLLVCASDDNHVEVYDANTYEVVKSLPSGPDPELFMLHPSGNPLYIANEDDNIVTIVDIKTRHDHRGGAGRRGARGHGHEPGRQDRRQHLRDDEHGPLHRHRRPTRSSPTCSSTPARASPSTRTTAPRCG